MFTSAQLPTAVTPSGDSTQVHELNEFLFGGGEQKLFATVATENFDVL